MKAPKIDSNHKQIRQAFRDMGATVADTANAHKGFPDLVVGFRGVNYLVEVKDGNKPPSKRKLTPDQVKFHAEWRGQICVVESVDDVIKLLQGINDEI